MSDTKVKPITVGDISASAVLFRDPKGNPEHVYVVVPQDAEFSAWKDKVWKANGFKNDYASAVGLHLDDTYEKRFFLVCCADCFSPPLAVVRAEHEAAAEEIFADELDWSHIGEADLGDYKEDDLHYNSNGQAYDAENVTVCEVVMLAVLCPDGLEAFFGPPKKA